MRSAPVIETKVRATTTTATKQNVIVLVCKIESETDTGWFVYGYRTNLGRRGTARTPQLYFVSKETR